MLSDRSHVRLEVTQLNVHQSNLIQLKMLDLALICPEAPYAPWLIIGLWSKEQKYGFANNVNHVTITWVMWQFKDHITSGNLIPKRSQLSNQSRFIIQDSKIIILKISILMAKRFHFQSVIIFHDMKSIYCIYWTL